MLRPNRFLSLFLATSLLLGATACDDDDDITEPAAQGRVRAIHAIGNAPAVDILVDGSVVTPAAGLAFGSKTSYLAADAGNRQLAVRATGTTANLLTLPASVAASTDYTVIAAGRLGATTGPTPRLIAVTDAAAPAAGQASIRVVHASPAAGNVDVYVTAPDANLATATPVTGLVNVPFGDVRGPVSVPAGTYRVRVTPTGTKTVAIDVDNVAVTAGQKFIAIAVGDNVPGTGSATPFNLLLFPENAN